MDCVRLLIVVATPPEANLLQAMIKFRSITQRPFPLWAADDMALVVSGIGRNRTAAACGYTAARFDASGAAWLNFGCAGHRDRPIGSAWLIHKIIDHEFKQTYYPYPFWDRSTQPSVCRTVTHPERTYDTSDLYDMEAAAFFAVASMFSPTELIHSLKIVSDNLAHPLPHSRKEIATTLTKRMREARYRDLFESTVRSLKDAATGYRERTSHIDARFFDQWHFTVSERHQLNKALWRWKLLQPNVDAFDHVKQLRTGKAVIHALEELSPNP